MFETTKEEDKEIDALDIAFVSGLKAGKNEAMEELEELIKKWQDEEKYVTSYSLFFKRVIEELSKHISTWELKTIPLAEVKEKLDAEPIPEGGS